MSAELSVPQLDSGWGADVNVTLQNGSVAIMNHTHMHGLGTQSAEEVRYSEASALCYSPSGVSCEVSSTVQLSRNTRYACVPDAIHDGIASGFVHGPSPTRKGVRDQAGERRLERSLRPLWPQP